MKKYIISLIASCFLLCSLSFGQAKRGEKPGNRGKPDFSQAQGKPSVSKDVQEVYKALKDGDISRKDAAEKIKAIRESSANKRDFKRPSKPELSDEVKAGLDAIKEKKDALHAAFKENLEALDKDATKEERMAAVEAFKEANKEKHQQIKAEYDAIREQIKASRPERPERPKIELSDELKADMEAIKAKREELHEAQKALHEKLKSASDEDRKAMITEFKEANKEKHQQIKEQSKALKKQVREQIETEETRTSDL